jgi:hypothetical protein
VSITKSKNETKLMYTKGGRITKKAERYDLSHPIKPQNIPTAFTLDDLNIKFYDF